MIKQNELSNHKKTWMNLKYKLLSERRQSEKVTYCMILIILCFGKGKAIKTVKRSVIAGGLWCWGRAV